MHYINKILLSRQGQSCFNKVCHSINFIQKSLSDCQWIKHLKPCRASNLNMSQIYEFTSVSESLGSFKWVKRKLKYFKLHLFSHENHRQTEIKCHVKHPSFLYGLQRELWHCSAHLLKRSLGFLLPLLCQTSAAFFCGSLGR